jgi:Protein of unknown function (DUF664)
MAATDHLGGRSDERSLLSGFLDWYRSVIERKVHDLSRDDAARVMTPTGLSLLGVVAHLAAAEVGWFAETFAGEPVDPMWEDYGSFGCAKATPWSLSSSSIGMPVHDHERSPMPHHRLISSVSSPTSTAATCRCDGSRCT